MPQFQAGNLDHVDSLLAFPHPHSHLSSAYVCQATDSRSRRTVLEVRDRLLVTITKG